MTLASLRLTLLAFVVGAATMVLELAAPRLLAPHLGTTVLVWTVTIATFLGGLALGHAWGGRLADRHARGWIALLLVASAGTVLLSVGVDGALRGALEAVPHTARALFVVPATFLASATVLGMVPPAIARAALADATRRGARLGGLAAAGATGSVVGTFLAGFVLVPRLGTRPILLTTAGVLALGVVLVPAKGAGRGSPRPSSPRRAARVPAGQLIVAALAGAALLVLEVAVGRVGADRLGSSIYTWTAAIGVVLAGSACGAWAGGRLADRVPPRRLLGWLFAGATLAACTLAWAPTILDAMRGQSLAWPVRVLVGFALVAFLPSAAIGAVSPVIARAALRARADDGRVVGAVYAAGTIGAVVGTVGTAYVFLPTLGLEATLLVAPLLLLVAATLVRRRIPWLPATTLLAVACLSLLPGARARAAAEAVRLPVEEVDAYVTDSLYARIRVVSAETRWIALQAPPDEFGLYADDLLARRADWEPARSTLRWTGPMTIREQARLRTHMETEADRLAIDRLRRLTKQDVRMLRIDRLIHSYINLEDPAFLGYDYERVYDAVLRKARPSHTPLSALFLGGGGYAYQRRLLTTREAPTSVDTVEIDAEVTRTAQAHLALPASVHHRIHHEDARTYVARLEGRPATLDVVFGDAFDDLAVPFHLTTLEFDRAVYEALKPDGLYLVNVVDAFDSGLFLGAFLHTLEQVFPHVALLTTAPRVDDDRNTFVVVASRAPVDLQGLRDENGVPLELVVYSREDIEALVGRAGARVLRDDHAPVEVLLAPIVEARR